MVLTTFDMNKMYFDAEGLRSCVQHILFTMYVVMHKSVHYVFKSYPDIIYYLQSAYNFYGAQNRKIHCFEMLESLASRVRPPSLSARNLTDLEVLRALKTGQGRDQLVRRWVGIHEAPR